MDRKYDLVLFGATGFTGKLTAAYLARRAAEEGLSWAIAGRSKEKLEAVRRDLARDAPACASLDLLVADSADEAALRAVAGSTRVVCTTVGPYAKHGGRLVAACADLGTHCCDITGEVTFMRDMIDRHHARAVATGARIVHTCGFDSIPSDLGALMLVDHLRARGKATRRVVTYVGEAKGGLSGGTAASMMNLMADATRDPEIRRLVTDPYALLPERDQGRGPPSKDSFAVRFDEDLGAWTGPFLMAVVNTRVVRRSNALLGFRYGPTFEYAEVASYGAGPKGLARATAITGGLGAFATLAAGKLTRAALERVLPSSGEGPSRQVRDTGYFKIRLLGWAEGDARPGARGFVAGTSDPGFGETAKMLGESALCLAKDPLDTPGGVTTPAASMGQRLITRLRAAGMRFDVEDATPSE